MDLVGLQHDDEAAGVDGLHGVLDLVELLVGAGAEHDVLRLAAVAPVTLQNRRAAVCHAVNFRAGGLAVIGHDHGQHRGREAEHHLVDDSRHDKIKHDTVNNGINILEHRTVEQDNRQRRRKRDVAERQVRMPCLDAHGDEVKAAGARVVHVDQRIADTADHAAANRRQQAVPLVDRHQRQQIVRKDCKEHHAVDTANKERSAKQFIGAEDDGDVDEHIAQAHGDAEQAV